MYLTNKQTLVHIATQVGHVNVIELLMNKGGSLTCVDEVSNNVTTYITYSCVSTCDSTHPHCRYTCACSKRNCSYNVITNLLCVSQCTARLVTSRVISLAAALCVDDTIAVILFTYSPGMHFEGA